MRIRGSTNKKLGIKQLKPNRDLAYFNELFEDGNFKPVLDKVYNFAESDVRKAFRRFGAATHTGKIVIRT